MALTQIIGSMLANSTIVAAQIANNTITSSGSYTA
jgi:hypothetical protein